MEYKPGIKNIIFDFGGVIIQIDYQRTIRSFHELGMTKFEEHYSKLKQSNLFDELEKGIISPVEFRNRIRIVCGLPLKDEEIDQA
jgi:hypothetical protein